MENASWLEGTWESRTNRQMLFYEKWYKVNDTLYRNINYHVEKQDTVIGGRSEIVIDNGQIFYTNGEKGDGKISWKATTFEPGKMIFENESVLQAKKISFTLGENKNWYASIYSVSDTTNYALLKLK